MHTLFDVGKLRVARDAPTKLTKLIDESKSIAELF